jgi:hypothetical protein
VVLKLSCCNKKKKKKTTKSFYGSGNGFNYAWLCLSGKKKGTLEKEQYLKIVGELAKFQKKSVRF